MLRFLVLTCFLASVYAVEGDVCMTEDECDPGECCQILSEFMVVSKRQTEGKSGTCEKYHLEGEGCSSFEKINGYCGCGPGLQCYTRQEPIPTTAAPTVTTVVRRDMMAAQPGYYWKFTCERPENIPTTAP